MFLIEIFKQFEFCMEIFTKQGIFLGNRRLDEWVPQERVDRARPIPEQEIKLNTDIVMIEGENVDRKITRNQKRKHDEINHVQKVFLVFPNFLYIYIYFSVCMMLFYFIYTL